MENNSFKIDFLELSFLATACIPPRPIARSMFWDKLINEYYHELNQEQRDNLFNWANREYAMEKGIENKNQECLMFNARYDKENQYTVETLYKEKKEIYDTFLLEGKYKINKNSDINPDFITKITKK